MRFMALATDYDGTIASQGRVAEPTWEALRKLKASGRKLFLVTGRWVDDLQNICPYLHLFDRVVAENGGVLYCPATRDQKLLASPPPHDFTQALRDRGLPHLGIGQTIVDTYRYNATAILQIIAELGLQMEVIYNIDSVMVLPAGVNKASGLTAALDELGLSPHNVVAVGDAENDRDFLAMCGCAAAVANALPMLTTIADLITNAEEGQGVVELIEGLLSDDLRDALRKKMRIQNKKVLE